MLGVLPIDSELGRIVDVVEGHQVVCLTATPGAGKTTRIPPALLARFQKILVIEPRRISCLASAQRIAEENQFCLGQEVGYEVRFDKKANTQTRITFMTDGLFLRKMHQPFSYDVIILDEFHERTWAYDLILGLLKENLELGLNFKLILMSATFSHEKMKSYFANSGLKNAFVDVQGQVFPLQIEYQRQPQQLLLQDLFYKNLVATVQNSLQKAHSILVFLPGSFEIDKASQWLQQSCPQLLIHKLHGQMSLKEQDEVIRFSSAKQRAILSTNLAESSLTIQNVDAVIDSGLQKISEHRALSGLNQLSLTKISLFSAKQRAGRAARTKAGIVYKMWNQMDEKSFDLETEPEILRTDLSEVLLFLASFGIQNPKNFYWLDTPYFKNMEQALSQLKTRNLITINHTITERGKRVLQLPFDYEKSVLLLEAESQNESHLGALIAAHLEGKSSSAISDHELRSDLLPLLQHGHLTPTQNRIYQQTLALLAPSPRKPIEANDVSSLLLKSWPHHLCRRREVGSDKAKHFSGMGAVLHRQSSAKSTEYFISVSAQESQNEISIRIAHGVDKPDVITELGQWITVEKNLEFNPENLNFSVITKKTLGAIEIDMQKSTAPFSEVKRLLQEDLSQRFEFYLKQEKIQEHQSELFDFFQLIQWVQNDLPTLTKNKDSLDSPLLENVPLFFSQEKLPLFVGMLLDQETSFRSLYEKNWWDYFVMYLQQEFALESRHIQEFQKFFPRSLKTSRGQRKIQYLREGPTVEARLQEFFGMKDHPTILKNTLPLRLVLLGPHYRPVQTTSNIVSFWKTSYPDIRKELRGQYPKHAWPEDPTLFLEEDSSKKSK